MTDVKIENHDVALDSAGRMVYLDGADALFQRALISASVGRGTTPLTPMTNLQTARSRSALTRRSRGFTKPRPRCRTSGRALPSKSR